MALALVLLVAACGGDDDAGPATTEAAASSTTAAEEATTTTSAADGPAVPSAGCGAGAATGEVTDERHEVAGTTGDEGAPRWYLLSAPEGEQPLPLVVDLHGLAEGAQVHTKMSAMGPYGQEQGFATVAPNGTGTPVSWNVGDGADSPDLDFIDAVLDDVGAQRCIDTSRVYATGLSNGAMMTSLLACFRADRFAAFAPVAGITSYESCEPSDPEAILAFHGTEDPILFFNGGVGDLSVVFGGDGSEAEPMPEADLDGPGYPATAAEWAALLGCDDEPREEPVTDQVLERTWDCPDGSEVTFVIVEGGGHTWPGSDFSAQLADIMGATTMDIDADEAMWEMFQRHRLAT